MQRGNTRHRGHRMTPLAGSGGSEMLERRVGLPARTAPCLVTRPGRRREVTDHRQQLLGRSWSSQHIYSFLLSLQVTACGDPGGAPASGGIQGRELDQCSAPWGRSRPLGMLCLTSCSDSAKSSWVPGSTGRWDREGKMSFVRELPVFHPVHKDSWLAVA